MPEERFKLIIAVYLFFIEHDKVLLLRRFNTGYEDGNYSLVSGHLDANESLMEAAIREAGEEAGVIIHPQDLELRITLSRKKDSRLDFFFLAKKWQGEITNKEPAKCDDLSWFSISDLPPNIIPYVKQAIECYKNRVNYFEI